MQLLEKSKRSIYRCFNIVKLRVILKSDKLFLPNLKDSATVFQKLLLFTTLHANAMFATLVVQLKN